MPIFIFLHLKSWFLFTDFLLKTYFHLVCFDVLLLPQFLPDHLHFPSCQSLCSFLSFKTNKNKRNTCTLPSSRWKCKQKTNKIKKMPPAKWYKKSTKISMSLFCVGLLLLDLRACPESVIHIPRETPLEKRDFPSPMVSVAESFLAGAGEVCVYILESWGELWWRNYPGQDHLLGNVLTVHGYYWNISLLWALVLSRPRAWTRWGSDISFVF